MDERKMRRGKREKKATIPKRFEKKNRRPLQKDLKKNLESYT